MQIAGRTRDLALFNLGIDSKLRGCDLVRLRVSDIAHGDQILSRAKVVQKKTGKPVSFEVTPETRGALQGWVAEAGLSAGDFLFFSRIDRNRHLTTRQYARRVHEWVDLIEADANEYGTHSLRRSKATLIYRRTKNLRAVQLLLGHTKLESTLRYLGVEVCGRAGDRGAYGDLTRRGRGAGGQTRRSPSRSQELYCHGSSERGKVEVRP